MLAAFQADWAKGGSTVMPITSAFIELNWSMRSRRAHISVVQTPVNAPGKNARTTFLPRYSLRLRCCWGVSCSVKSGAACPTVMAIEGPPGGIGESSSGGFLVAIYVPAIAGIRGILSHAYTWAPVTAAPPCWATLTADDGVAHCPLNVPGR